MMTLACWTIVIAVGVPLAALLLVALYYAAAGVIFVGLLPVLGPIHWWQNRRDRRTPEEEAYIEAIKKNGWCDDCGRSHPRHG
jgi:hypothetical protein